VSDTTATQGARAAVLRVRDEIAKAVVGQDGAVSGLVAALLVRGHVLLEGVPCWSRPSPGPSTWSSSGCSSPPT
jgi:hypothetical protein